MQDVDYLKAAASLLEVFTFDRLVPLVMLSAISLLGLWVLFSAQRRGDFDASQFIRNDRGVLALDKLIGFACFGVHTWAYATWVLNKTVVKDDTLLYGVLWSGTALGYQLLETWRGIRSGTPIIHQPLPPTTPEPTVPDVTQRPDQQ